MKASRWLVVLLLLMLGIAPAGAQDANDDELPVIPYFTAYEGTQQFNIPIPDGWQVIDNDADYVQLSPTDADASIYVFAEQQDSTEAAVTDAVSRIFPDAGEPRELIQEQISLDGIRWDKSVFDVPDAGNISTFTRQQEGQYYVLAMVNPNPEEDYYILAVESEDVSEQESLEAALNTLYPDFDAESPDSTSEVQFDNTWTRSAYTLTNAGALHALHRTTEFNRTYAVVERGDGSLIDGINQDFFTTLFGFFVTPENSNFLYLGLGVTGGLLLLLVGSIWMRHQSVQRDLKLIQQLQDDDKS